MYVLRAHGDLFRIGEWVWECFPRPLETGFMWRCRVWALPGGTLQEKLTALRFMRRLG